MVKENLEREEPLDLRVLYKKFAKVQREEILSEALGPDLYCEINAPTK